MSLKDFEALATIYVPNSESFILTPRDYAAAIWTEYKGFYIVHMSPKDFKALATLDIPNSKRFVIAPRNDKAVVWAEYKEI
jgi:hypothetical protein